MAFRTFLTSALIAVVGFSAGCQRPNVLMSQSVYTCYFASGPMTIDGKLDEPAWQKAERITAFHVLQPSNAKKLSPTTVRLLWDDQHVYIAYECVDDDIWSYSKVADDELWNGDVGECFIKPAAKENSYYEFVIAPNGTLFDARYPSRGAGGYRRFKSWSSGATVATRIDGTDGDPRDADRGYTIEMAIPLSAIADGPKPADGATWTFAVFRYDYTKSYEDPLLLMSIPESPHHGFHYYEGYQTMVFRSRKK